MQGRVQDIPIGSVLGISRIFFGFFSDFFEFSWDKSKSGPTAGWVDESVHKMSREGFAALQWLSTLWADSVNAVEASGAMSKLRCGGGSRSIGGQ